MMVLSKRQKHCPKGNIVSCSEKVDTPFSFSSLFLPRGGGGGVQLVEGNINSDMEQDCSSN